MWTPTIWGRWSENVFGLNFWPAFCNQKRYFSFFSFWLDKMVLSQKWQMKPPHFVRSRIKKSCRIAFLIPFVTKTTFCDFQLSAWWNDYESKVANETTHNLGSRIRKSCQIEFSTPFCNQKLYFRLFSHIYA